MRLIRRAAFSFRCWDDQEDHDIHELRAVPPREKTLQDGYHSKSNRSSFLRVVASQVVGPSRSAFDVTRRTPRRPPGLRGHVHSMSVSLTHTIFLAALDRRVPEMCLQQVQPTLLTVPIIEALQQYRGQLEPTRVSILPVSDVYLNAYSDNTRFFGVCQGEIMRVPLLAGPSQAPSLQVY